MDAALFKLLVNGSNFADKTVGLGSNGVAGAGVIGVTIIIKVIRAPVGAAPDAVILRFFKKA